MEQITGVLEFVGRLLLTVKVTDLLDIAVMAFVIYKLLKLVKSAAANAENNHGMDPEKLYVSEVFATPGPIIKRMMPRAQGRGYRINKRTSHVTIAVAER